MSSKKLSFGIIGCGRIAQTHVKHLSDHGKVVAVCDPIREKAEVLAASSGSLCYADHLSMLAAHPELDLVSVCTPNGLHALHAVDTLERGIHVLCEKPMALTVTDCHSMIAAAKRVDRQLFIVKQNRFNPPVVEVRRLIEEGKLGSIYSLQLNCFWNRNPAYYENSWKGTKDLDGGTLFTQFSHFIDLVYWIMGDVKEISAITGNYGHKGLIEFEDTGAVILQFVNGAIGSINYTVNSYRRNMEGSLTLFGEKGTVKIGGQYLNELEYQQIENYQITNLSIGNQANDYGNYQGSMSNHDKMIKNVVDVLNNGSNMIATPYEALKTVEIINRIYKVAQHIS